MTKSVPEPSRSTLPIPEQVKPQLTTYDAKDPSTSFPPITPLRPPADAPNVLVILLDDTGFGASSAFGGPVNTPTFERLAGAGLRYSRFHTTALCSPTRAALLSGRNHHSVGMGGITEIATSAPGYSSLRPNSCAPLAQTLTLNGYSTAQFGKCHEVPVLADEPDGPVRQLALRRWRVRAFLRLPRWRDEPVCAGALRRHGARRAGSHAGGGLPPQRRSLRPGDRVGAPAEGPDARQAVLRLFRARCDARPASRARGMVGEIQRRLRPGVGCAARGDIRASEAAGRDRRRCRSDRAARADSRVGGHAGCPQARARPSDGGLRGLSRAHRPPRGAADRRPRRHGGAGRHARVRDHRRQRRIRRGHRSRAASTSS